jgi:hypothetical protein
VRGSPHPDDRIVGAAGDEAERIGDQKATVARVEETVGIHGASAPRVFPFLGLSFCFVKAEATVLAACGELDSPDAYICAETERLLLSLREMTEGPPVPVPQQDADRPECAVLQWASIGAMALTGPPDGPPTAPREPVAPRITASALAFRAVTDRWLQPVEVDTNALLTSRATEAGWSRRGVVSVNGSASMLRCADGWLATNLARPYDFEVLPAVLGTVVAPEHARQALADWTENRDAAAVVAALQLVGIPAAVVGSCADVPPLAINRYGRPLISSRRVPLVVDLSAMWAGPLAAHLLSRAGARVITVEDLNRPDGARFGPPLFYADLHAGHDSVHFDFTSEAGRADLIELVAESDIVIEASRPRALRRLGLIAEEVVAARPGRTWLSITGYGRDRFEGNRVAFGDDAAAAGGLIALDGQRRPLFCADAIADPLTGLRAALAVVASQLAGGGHLLDVAMAGVSADIARPVPGGRLQLHRIEQVGQGWSVTHEAFSIIGNSAAC